MYPGFQVTYRRVDKKVLWCVDDRCNPLGLSKRGLGCTGHDVEQCYIDGEGPNTIFGVFIGLGGVVGS